METYHRGEKGNFAVNRRNTKPVDVSQTTLEGNYFYSELLFNKMSCLLHRKDGENCLASAEELASAKQELMKEEQVSYRYTF